MNIFAVRFSNITPITIAIFKPPISKPIDNSAIK